MCTHMHAKTPILPLVKFALVTSKQHGEEALGATVLTWNLSRHVGYEYWYTQDIGIHQILVL